MSFLDALLTVLNVLLNVLLIVGSPLFVMIYSIILGFALVLAFIVLTIGAKGAETYGEYGLISTFWEGVAYWAGWFILSILVAATIATCSSALSAGNILYW